MGGSLFPGKVTIAQYSHSLPNQFEALDESKDLIGVVICKLESTHRNVFRGYIAMLVVLEEFRGRGIATHLVKMAIDAMIDQDADEVRLGVALTSCQAADCLRFASKQKW